MRVEAVAGKKKASVATMVRGYSIALLSVALSLAITLLVQHLFPYPFLFLFFGAVMVSAWFGGVGAGLFAVLISTLVVAYFFVPPFYSWQINATAETYFVAFIACALVASWVSSAKKKSEEELRDARDQLEIRVSERSAALMHTQNELAHLSRALSMGELTASLAHEINQPLTAVVANGHACLEWLSANPPNFGKARQSVEHIIQDGTRAGEIVTRTRALYRKEPPIKDWVDVNEIIQELTVFLRPEATNRQVTISSELTPKLPKVKADRIQLQQVLLNLLSNGMEAMNSTSAADKIIIIRSQKHDPNEVLISVEDHGAGVNPDIAEKIFDPFFTTKPHGIGMGLSISRSIIEAHEGRLWVAPASSGGAIFEFSLPVQLKGKNG
jgi:C4-dicarboxylate-specific signal transduction histidine kinase